MLRQKAGWGNQRSHPPASWPKKVAGLIASIPGIGMTAVARVLSHVDDIRRFDNAKAFAAFVEVM